MGAGTIVDYFAKLEDPRTHLKKNRHKLIDILVIAICGSICGADDWVSIADFGKAKFKWLRTFLELSHGIPSHDTFGRVFSLIRPDKYRECFMSWIQSVARICEGEIVAVDGKTLRRSYDSKSNTAAIHMVSAWADANRLVLGQVKTDAKSNEITAIPELLKILDFHGCIVTIDAMGCQKKIAGLIMEGGGDYVLGLKGNQGTLLDAVEQTFGEAREKDLNGPGFDFHQTQESGHGRRETRSYFTTSLLDRLPDREEWKGLRTIGAVLSEVTRNGKTTRRGSRRPNLLFGRRYSSGAPAGHPSLAPLAGDDGRG